MPQFFAENSILLLILLAWTLYWKGRALWIAALRRHHRWFIALLLVQTLGVLDILYVYYISKRKFKTIRVFTQTFVAVAALIEKDGKFLLVKEGLGADKGKWNTPAGWVEPGDNPTDAVKTEVREEAGLEFEPTHVVGIYSLVRQDLRPRFKVAPHVVRIVYAGKVLGGDGVPKKQEEIQEVRYFSPKEIQDMGSDKLRDSDIKKTVQQYQQGKQYPLEVIEHNVST